MVLTAPVSAKSEEESALQAGALSLLETGQPMESREIAIEIDGRLREYHVTIVGPFSTFASVPTVVTDQMKQDGLSLAPIATQLRQWALAHPDVECVALRHTGKRYTLAVRLAEFSQQRVAEVHRQLVGTKDRFADHALETYVLGPEQRDMKLFHAYGVYIVYESTKKATRHVA